jgi:hypothetical protein
MRVLLGLVTCAVLALVPAGRLAASGSPPCTITWDGGASGSWHNPASWNPDRLPGPGDVVCIPAGANVTHSESATSVATVLVDGVLSLASGTLTVTSTADQSTIVTLNLGGGTLDAAATVLLTGSGANGSFWTGGRMAGPGATRIASGATLDLSGSSFVTLAAGRSLDVRGKLNWSGGYILQGGTSSGIFVGSGGLFDITSDSSTYVPLSIRSGGTLRKSGGSWFTEIGTSLKNGGRIEVLSGTIAVTGPFRNFSGTTLDGGEYLLRGGALRFYGANIVTNQASVTLDGASGGIQDPSGADAFVNLARNAPGGSLTLQGGRDMTVPGLFRNEGTLFANAGSTFSVANDAFVNASGSLLQGTGTIDANVGSAGEVAPGLSPGALTILGNYVQQSDGRLRIELTGQMPGTEYDRLVVGGSATLDGRLTLESAPGFLPPVGTQFNILGGLRFGEFATVEGDLLQNGSWYAPLYQPVNVLLIVRRGLSLRR